MPTRIPTRWALIAQVGALVSGWQLAVSAPEDPLKPTGQMDVSADVTPALTPESIPDPGQRIALSQSGPDLPERHREELPESSSGSDTVAEAQQVARTLAAQADFSAAAHALLSLSPEHWTRATPLALAELVGYLDRAGRPLTEIAGIVPVEHGTSFLAQLLLLPPSTASRVLLALYEQDRRLTVEILATAGLIAPRLNLEEALIWSHHLREHGVARSCPLVAIASDTARPISERARAAASGYQLYDDPRLAAVFSDVLESASETERSELLQEVAVLCPKLVRSDVSKAIRSTQATEGRAPSGETQNRPAASIVILAWNAWEHTRKCLDSLRRGLGPDDEVIVVDNASSDGTAVGLEEYPWIKVVSNTSNRGFAGGCNDGARLASRDVVVFLNNDTVVPRIWLSTLLQPFSDQRVMATGPRSNGVSGAQLVQPVPYGSPLLPEFERFANCWATWFRGQVTKVSRLVGFCLAVRLEAFRAVDGFDERYVGGGFEDDDLCRKLMERGGTLQIAHACFVHHDAHTTFRENDIDWYAVQCTNQERFRQKWEVAEASDRIEPARV